jgi:hypothetical protein
VGFSVGVQCGVQCGGSVWGFRVWGSAGVIVAGVIGAGGSVSGFSVWVQCRGACRGLFWDTGESFLGRLPPGGSSPGGSHFSIGKREYKWNRYSEMSDIWRNE